jgi:hypothetical protein
MIACCLLLSCFIFRFSLSLYWCMYIDIPNPETEQYELYKSSENHRWFCAGNFQRKIHGIRLVSCNCPGIPHVPLKVDYLFETSSKCIMIRCHSFLKFQIPNLLWWELADSRVDCSVTQEPFWIGARLARYQANINATDKFRRIHSRKQNTCLRLTINPLLLQFFDSPQQLLWAKFNTYGDCPDHRTKHNHQPLHSRRCNKLS